MQRVRLAICLAVVWVMAAANTASADTFGNGANQFTIDFVPISGSTNPTSGYGIVNNDYRMGTYEISNDQWNKFKAAYGTVTGSDGGYSYSPYFSGLNVPTNNVSWYEAAQFVNYLNTSTGHQAAYKFTGTQGTGDYMFAAWNAGDASSGTNLFRHKNAFYFLPTENEWVKAAYWNGTSLQTYATKAGQTPFQGNGTNGGWNYYTNQYATNPYGPWAATSGSQELNGTYNMMGNASEWMESPYSTGNYLSGLTRGVRGGAYNSYGPGYSSNSDLMSSSRYQSYPYFEGNSGFRVASVPEPTTMLLLGLGGIFLRRKRKH